MKYMIGLLLMLLTLSACDEQSKTTYRWDSGRAICFRSTSVYNWRGDIIQQDEVPVNNSFCNNLTP